MALFGCIFTAPGHVVAPESFKASVQRGNNFRAAAFREIRGDGQVFIVRAFKAGTELKTARDNILKQLTRGGTIGLKFPGADLQLQECRAFDTAPYYTAAEILFDTGLLQAQIAVVPPRAAIARDEFATLGLAAGATQDQIKSAFRSAVLEHHPDKGGDAGKFDDVMKAYESLRGAPEGVPKSAIQALPYEADVDAHTGMVRAAVDRVAFCEGQLKAAKQQLAQVSTVANKKCGDVERTARRVKAQRFVQEHFNRSAKYWDPVYVMCWFRPKQGFPPLGVSLSQPGPERDQWIASLDAYGENLRMGNEDLDPVIKFVSWTSEHRFQGEVAFRIKVGLDYVDIVDHGVELVVNASYLTCYNSGRVPCAKTLVQLGWNRDEARSLAYGGWVHDFDVASCMARKNAAASSRKRLQVEVSNEAARPSDEVSEMEDIHQSFKRRRLTQSRQCMQVLYPTDSALDA